mmetsp:Transcript_528/g.870  ORF Transcript_528/g.870 Transcript_528/m.870 type:complete len:460 (+) Transcript_528:144-1523(+)
MKSQLRATQVSFLFICILSTVLRQLLLVTDFEFWKPLKGIEENTNALHAIVKEEVANNKSRGVSSSSEIRQHTTDAVLVKGPPCYRTCQNYSNRIVLMQSPSAGLNDRVSVIGQLSNIAAYLCAKLVVPPPSAWLATFHNGGAKVSANLTWVDDFVTFRLLGRGDNDNSALDEAKDFFEQNTASNNWTRITSTKAQLREHFDVLREYTFQQQKRLENGDTGIASFNSNATTKPFIWTMEGKWYSIRGELLSHIEHIRSSTGNKTEEDREQRNMLPVACSSHTIEWSPHIMETVRQVQLEITARTGGCKHFGLIHIRRGDSKKKCDTTVEKMKDYLACTFNGTENALGINFTLLYSSDDTNKSYRNAVKKLIERNGRRRSLDLDLLVQKTLQAQVSAGTIPASKLNNYITFAVVSRLSSGAALNLARRRTYSCNDCDKAIVEKLIARRDDLVSSSKPLCS